MFTKDVLIYYNIYKVDKNDDYGTYVNYSFDDVRDATNKKNYLKSLDGCCYVVRIEFEIPERRCSL